MTHSPATHALSVNPATGETLAAYPWASQDDVDRRLRCPMRVSANGATKRSLTVRKNCVT